jgi:FAD synthetase
MREASVSEKYSASFLHMKNVVLVGGCFDILHFGHISFLKDAKKLGDKLIVALESDGNVREMKGPTRPIHNQKQRKVMIESLRFVDEIIELPPMWGYQDYFNLVKKIKPQIIAVTEGDPILDKKQKQADLVGARLVVIPKIQTLSTSQLAKLLELE